MAYGTNWIYTYDELKLNEAVVIEKERIKKELKQAIENGVIKIEQGNEELFKIIGDKLN